VEFRELSKAEQREHSERAGVLEERINALAVDLEYVEKEDPEQMKLNAAQAVDHNALIDKGKAIQETDINILVNMNRQLQETEQIGSTTVHKMAEYNDQIKRIDKDVDEVASNIKLASRQVRVMVRKLATDKLIMCLMFLVFAGVIVIIVYSAVGGKNAPKTNIPQDWQTS